MRKPRGYWNYKHCYDEAQKYKTRMDFKKGCSSAYDVAKKNKWLDDYKWFELVLHPNGYWTYERCYEEARKYSLMKDFSNQSSSAHAKARKEGWIKDYTWLELIGKHRGFWNDYQNCYNEAKKYTTLRDFEKNCPAAINVCRKNDWLENFTWFETKQRKPGSWNYDSCYIAAKECKTLVEFYTKYPGAYSKAMRSNWIEDFTWLEKFFKWTYEACCEESKKYKSRSEFCENCVGGYTRALEKGWLDDFTWLKPKLIKEPCNKGSVYWIYGYFDFCKKVCYIGLSRDKARHWRHKQKDKKGNFDSVMSYFNEKYSVLPEPTIIEEALTAETAQEKEAYYIQFFVEKGYTLLNKMKAGSLGSAIVKWDKAACYNEARRFVYYDDFYIKSPSAYKQANENGWIDEYIWLQRKHTKRGFWQDYNNCINEAKKYVSISEFQKNAPGAYNSSTDNGWIDDYTWFVRNTSKEEFTYDICYDLAKKCKNVSEFIKKSSTAYRAAKENGWLKDYVWFKEIVRWTDELVMELACRYSSATIFRNENSGAYNYMLKHSLPHPSSWKANRPQWTYDTCYAEAKKYEKRSDYRKNSKTSYVVARDNGWLTDFAWLKVTSKPNGYWTYDRCHEEAKKYKTKREFEKGSPGAYDAVITHKWMGNFAYLFGDGRKPKGYWNNYDNCYKEALNYTRVSHFKKGCMGAYSVSKKNGWLKSFKWLFENKNQLNLFD